MIDQYVTGSGGFIGKHLLSKLHGRTVTIPHRHIDRYVFNNSRRFFFLSTFGNMANHAITPEARVKMVNANLLNVFDALRCPAVESFVYVSSSSVTLPTQTPYSRTKRAAEEMLQAMAIPYCIIRPYSVTGVGEQPEHLIPKLIRSCFTGEPMNLTLRAVHDFIDVEDVVDGMIQLADEKRVGIFELGTGIPLSNGAIWKIVEGISGKKANVTIVDQMRQYDNLDWYCKNPAPGWTPRKSVEQSITEMVEAYAI